jgi:transcriptional regulator with XRE-family HTH domain
VGRAYLSRVERAVTYVGLEIIEKPAGILEVDPAEFFRRPGRAGSRRVCPYETHSQARPTSAAGLEWRQGRSVAHSHRAELEAARKAAQNTWFRK